jgi:ABC-type molybdate transport system ATPase subunit
MLRQIEMPMLFVSHDREEIAALCDQVIVLDRGLSSEPAKTLRSHAL